ncbi:MAG TPA: hypothetical protein VMX97_03395, partial [Hyphomicrobiaceae bacterium]|nr:hypothetical protein [Hyphomicrobiaceae bacterium]
MWRRFRRYIAYAAMAFAGAAVMACLALATPAGQRGLITIAARWASSAEMSIRVDGFTGSLFSTGRVASIVVSDSKGRWLSFDGMSFAWQPSALIGGRLRITDLSIERISTDRLPAKSHAGSKAGSPSRSLSDLKWRLPIGVEIGNVTLKEIVLGSDLFGVPVRLTSTASLSLNGFDRDLGGAVNIRRIDGNGGAFSAAVVYRAATGMVAGDIELSEPAGGLVARLIESPGLPPLRAILKGRGTLGDLAFDLTMQSEQTVFTAGKGRSWVEGGRRRFSGQVDGYLETVLPARWRDLLAGRTQARLTGDISPDGQFRVETGVLTSDALRVNAQGKFDVKRSFVHGNAEVLIGRSNARPVKLPVADAHPLSITAANIKLSLADARAQRPVLLTASVQGLQHRGVTAMLIELSASGIQPAPHDQGWWRIENLKIEQSATNVYASDPLLQGLLAPSLQARLWAHTNASGLIIDGFSAESARAKISGAGAVRGYQFDGRVDTSVAGLSMFSGLAGRDLGGKLKLSGKGRWHFGGGPSNVDTEMVFDDPTSGISQLDSLFAGTTTVQAKLKVDRRGGFRIEKGDLSGSGVSANLTFQQADGKPTGRFTLQLGQLERLHADLRGGVIATATLWGTTDDPSGELKIEDQGLRWRGKPVSGLTLKLNGTGSPARFRGELSVASRYDGKVGEGKLRIARSEHGGIKLEGVDLRHGRSRVQGWLVVGSPKGINGDLTIDAPDLREFSGLFGVPVSGKLTARLMEAGKTKPSTLGLIVRADRLSFDKISFRHAILDGKLTDPLGAQQGAATLKINGGVVGGYALSELTVTVAGKLASAGTFRVEGRSGSGSLLTSGTLAVRKKALAVR